MKVLGMDVFACFSDFDTNLVPEHRRREKARLLKIKTKQYKNLSKWVFKFQGTVFKTEICSCTLLKKCELRKCLLRARTISQAIIVSLSVIGKMVADANITQFCQNQQVYIFSLGVPCLVMQRSGNTRKFSI